MTEALVLSTAGAVAGLVLAKWAAGALLRLSPPEIAGLGTTMDLRVLLFTVAVALAVGIAFGLMPAIQFSRGSLTDALAEGERAVPVPGAPGGPAMCSWPPKLRSRWSSSWERRCWCEA